MAPESIASGVDPAILHRPTTPEARTLYTGKTKDETTVQGRTFSGDQLAQLTDDDARFPHA